MQHKEPVNLTLYRWAGNWGPFSVKISCGECALTHDVIDDTLANELAGIDVNVVVKDWLDVWWEPLPKGGWHAPIVMVDGKIVSQGVALNRGLLTQAVIEANSQRVSIEGSHFFGKDGCPHCVRAKEKLDRDGIPYQYHDVVKDEAAMYEMISRVKPIIGHKTPVTVPQIWLDGEYVGGADQLSKEAQVSDTMVQTA